jgi:hypothetical protein
MRSAGHSFVSEAGGLCFLFLSRRTSDKLADPLLNFRIDERIVQVLWVLSVGIMNNDACATHSGADPPNCCGRPRIS